MEYTEKQAPLAEGELSKPLKIRKMQNIAPFVIFFTIIPPVSFVLIKDHSILPAVLLAILTILIMGGVFFITNKYNKKILQDYKNGRKIIIRGILAEKFITGWQRSTMYYFIIGTRQLKIHPNDYYNFEAGQPVEIHIAPISEYVIRIEALKQSGAYG